MILHCFSSSWTWSPYWAVASCCSRSCWSLNAWKWRAALRLKRSISSSSFHHAIDYNSLLLSRSRPELLLKLPQDHDILWHSIPNRPKI
jgi:hypothetical protein